MDIYRQSESEFRRNPVGFVELAHSWAAGGMVPSTEHETWLNRLSRPRITKPADARNALWGVLSYPERGRALVWLNRFELLNELLSSWEGNEARQSLRLRAVDEVHLERWAQGLTKIAFDWLCVYMDQRADGKLGGWALTGLATLLLTGDEETESWALRIEKDLLSFGAKPGETGRVVTAVREFPLLYDAILSGHALRRTISPTAIIATLSTLFAEPCHSDEIRIRGMQFADQLLLRFAAPEEHPASDKRRK